VLERTNARLKRAILSEYRARFSQRHHARVRVLKCTLSAYDQVEYAESQLDVLIDHCSQAKPVARSSTDEGCEPDPELADIKRREREANRLAWYEHLLSLADTHRRLAEENLEKAARLLNGSEARVGNGA